MLGIRGTTAARYSNRGPTNGRHARHRTRRAWWVEQLEGRTLLSTYTVNSLGDSGTGSGLVGDLRYVITQVDNTTVDNTINFSVTGTITLMSALPDLSNKTGVTDIEGPGAASLTVTRDPTALGFGIFTVDAGVKAKLVGLTVTGGAGTYYSGCLYGGAIYNQGNSTITGCNIAGNHVGSDLYAGYGSGVYNSPDATLLVTDCTIQLNTVQRGNEPRIVARGGGIYNESGGTVTVIGSSVSGNSADGYGGGIYSAGLLNVSSSTITWSQASSGGGVAIFGGTAFVTNSTFNTNYANAVGGGILVESGSLTVSK